MTTDKLIEQNGSCYCIVRDILMRWITVSNKQKIRILTDEAHLTLACRFAIDCSKVFGGARWWLQSIATALLALL